MLMMTRELLLARQGYHVRRLDEFADITEALERTCPRLMLLCQTCTPKEAAEIMATSVEVDIRIKALMISIKQEGLELLTRGVWRMNGKCPRQLLTAVEQVLAEA